MRSREGCTSGLSATATATAASPTPISAAVVAHILTRVRWYLLIESDITFLLLNPYDPAEPARLVKLLLSFITVSLTTP
jgi:hypothetical protein